MGESQKRLASSHRFHSDGFVDLRRLRRPSRSTASSRPGEPGEVADAEVVHMTRCDEADVGESGEHWRALETGDGPAPTGEHGFYCPAARVSLKATTGASEHVFCTGSAGNYRFYCSLRSSCSFCSNLDEQLQVIHTVRVQQLPVLPVLRIRLAAHEGHPQSLHHLGEKGKNEQVNKSLMRKRNKTRTEGSSIDPSSRSKKGATFL